MVGLQLNWQERWKKLWTAYSYQAKEPKAFKWADTLEGISNQFVALKSTISARYQIIRRKDKLIEEMGLTIANKDLLLSSADPNALPIYADIKVANLSGLVYGKYKVFSGRAFSKPYYCFK